MESTKYLFESTIHAKMFKIALMQQDVLSISKELKKYDYHIYLLCKRPRFTINPQSIQIDKKEIKGIVYVEAKDCRKEIPICYKQNPKHIATKFSCEYPFNYTEFFDTDDKLVFGGKVAMLIPYMIPKYIEELNMEVVYVGQAYGEKGKRKVQDRLITHPTLQAIYSDIIIKDPLSEVWIIPLIFEIRSLSMFNSMITDITKVNLEESKKHFVKVKTAIIPDEQGINFTEAALIKYFEPAYNTEFKDSFPKEYHKSYSDCYELDVNAVSFELYTHEIVTQLYTNKVKAKVVHMDYFPLHSPEERKSMFDFLK